MTVATRQAPPAPKDEARHRGPRGLLRRTRHFAEAVGAETPAAPPVVEPEPAVEAVASEEPETPAAPPVVEAEPTVEAVASEEPEAPAAPPVVEAEPTLEAVASEEPEAPAAPSIVEPEPTVEAVASEPMSAIRTPEPEPYAPPVVAEASEAEPHPAPAELEIAEPPGEPMDQEIPPVTELPEEETELLGAETEPAPEPWTAADLEEPGEVEPALPAATAEGPLTAEAAPSDLAVPAEEPTEPSATVAPEAPTRPAEEPAVPERALPERLAALASEVLDARMGLEAPGVLFAMLQKHFGLRRGAILVPDDTREEYTPWASEGLDRTSLRRLRLDGEAVSRLTPGAVVGGELEGWLKLFSTRDSGAIERLHHWPCPSDSGVSAVVLALDVPAALADDPVFREHLPQVLEAAGHALADRRERELERVRSSAGRDVTAPPERIIGDGLTTAAQREAVLVRLSLTPLLEAATAAAPATDHFRLTRDIGRILSHVTRETGDVVIAASPEDLYLLFYSSRSPDADLWIHALLDSLGPLLPTVAAIPELPTRSIRYPRDGRTALELMSALG